MKEETKLHKDCLAILDDMCVSYINNINNTNPGTADIAVCLGGNYVEIEFKTGQGEVRESQTLRKFMVENNLGCFRIVRNKDEFMKVISEFFTQKQDPKQLVEKAIEGFTPF